MGKLTRKYESMADVERAMRNDDAKAGNAGIAFTLICMAVLAFVYIAIKVMA